MNDRSITARHIIFINFRIISGRMMPLRAILLWEKWSIYWSEQYRLLSCAKEEWNWKLFMFRHWCSIVQYRMYQKSCENILRSEWILHTQLVNLGFFTVIINERYSYVCNCMGGLNKRGGWETFFKSPKVGVKLYIFELLPTRRSQNKCYFSLISLCFLFI